MKRSFRIIALLLACVLIVGLAASCGKKKVAEPEETASSTSETVETTTKAPETTTKPTEETTTFPPVTEPVNFIMFGIDTYGYTPVDIDKSDMIMCVQLDPKSQTIKFISLLRDTKAEIEGHDPQKINAAYQYGGAPLAIKTVNENFGLEYEDYITLDWHDLIVLVDEIGGIDVEISEKEAQKINGLNNKWDLMGDGRNKRVTPVSAGMAHMEGCQAIMFSRVRSIDSDYYRAGRQQRALTAIIDKIKTIPVSKYPALIKTFIDTVEETSFTVEDLLPWLTMGLEQYKIEGYIIPDPDYEPNLFGGVDNSGQWVWIYDMKEAGNRLKKILNNEFIR